jgi:hypothetical protein
MLINAREYRKSNQNGQSRETTNIGYTRRRKTKQKYNTICVGHHYAHTKTNNVNKTWAQHQHPFVLHFAYVKFAISQK